MKKIKMQFVIDYHFGFFISHMQLAAPPRIKALHSYKLPEEYSNGLTSPVKPVCKS